MRTILVDDELIAMNQFEQECSGIEEIDIVGKFDNAEDAISFAENNRVEFALVDICMPNMDGLELGRKLKKMYPDMILIYVTGYSKYVLDTIKVRADYCVMKPYTMEDVHDAIERAKLLSKRQKNKVRVDTLGRFEVYVDDKPIYFGNSKARELFAYCVYRDGAIVTMDEAIEILWPERPYDDKVKRLYRKAIGAIVSAFEQEDIVDVFTNKRGVCYVDVENIECDIIGREPQLSPIQEEKLEAYGYMSEYSWAEEKTALLMSTIY